MAKGLSASTLYPNHQWVGGDIPVLSICLRTQDLIGNGLAGKTSYCDIILSLSFKPPTPHTHASDLPADACTTFPATHLRRLPRPWPPSFFFPCPLTPRVGYK